MEYSWLSHKERLCILENSLEQSTKKLLVLKPNLEQVCLASLPELQARPSLLAVLFSLLGPPERWFQAGCFHIPGKKYLFYISWGVVVAGERKTSSEDLAF